LVCGHDARGAARKDVHEYPQLFSRPWAAIVVDESQNALVRTSGIETQVRTGMTLLRTQQDGLRIALSGTPFRSRPHLLWGTLNWLRPAAYTSMWSWAETYFFINEDAYGKSIGGIRPESEAELWKSLDGIMLRRIKSEVATDLPPKQYVGEDHPLGAGVWLEMQPAQAKAYKQMLDTSVASLASGELGAVGILAEMTRLKQFAVAHGDMEEDAFLPSLPSNKFDYLLQMLEERGFLDGNPMCKVVVASQFTKVLELFAKELTAKLGAEQIVSITGEITGARRKLTLDSFNRPVGTGPHLMFLNTKAGGVAITIDSADEMVVLDETWVPDEQQQLEDRIHRVSNPRPVWYHYLRSLGSIEEAIAEVARARDEASKRLLDGRRGVEYGQKVLTEARKMAKR
jgi:SNF2 family DNA or RNA helicase